MQKTLLIIVGNSLWNVTTIDYCWKFAMECYNCEQHYIQMLGVYMLGLIGNPDALHFLKSV